MNTFTFIVGPVAAGKTTFMENKLYNLNKKECNFFDHDKAKLMIQLYANDKSKFNDINLGIALKNAIHDSILNHKDFMMQIHFTTEQLSQINSYLHEYKNKFDFVDKAKFYLSNLDISEQIANNAHRIWAEQLNGANIFDSEYLCKMKECN